MKKSLETLISDLPPYIKGDNGETYILTIQPSAIVDKFSKIHKCWTAGYLYVSDEMIWLHLTQEETLYKSICSLIDKLRKNYHCSECNNYIICSNHIMFCKALQKRINAKRKPCKFFNNI